MKRQMMAAMLILITIFIGFGIIIPIMPEIVRRSGAASYEFHLGMMLSVYSAVSFFMSPFWGGLSDKIGRRPIIMIGVIGFSVSFLLFGLAGENLWIMYASRVLGGIFSGATTSCIVAYVADITTQEQRTKGMALVGMSIGLGFTFGPAIGGLLSGISLAVPFYAAAVLSLVTFIVAFAFLPESLPAERRNTNQGPRVSRWTAFTGSIKYLYVLAFFVTFSLAGLEGTLQLFEIEKFNVTPFDIGLMFFFCGLVGALVQGGVVRKMIKNGDEKKVIAIGLVISAIGFFSLLASTSFWNATLFLCIFGVGNSLIRPCVTSLITQKTTVGQGVASGLSSSMDSLGRIFGPLLGTLIFSFNISLPYILGGVLSLAALFLLARFHTLDRTKRAAQSAA